MKILLVNDYGTPTAGAERLTRDFGAGLRARGHTVRMLSSRAQLIEGDTIADVECFGTTSRLQTLTSTINFSAARALREEIRSFRPDVVQVQMFLWQLSPSILGELQNVPAVYWAMTYKAVCPTGLKWLPAGTECQQTAGAVCLKNRCISAPGFVPLMLQRSLWRRSRRAFNTIVGCSTAVRNHFESDNIAVHSVINPGVPRTHARTTLDAKPTVTFTGRLVHEKGVSVLLEAFRIVQRELPDARLRIAGSGPLLPTLSQRISSLGMIESAELCGQLGDEELATLLSTSWVHVVPSLWPEPFGITATEAMMRGVAVVASNCGGLADIVDNGTTGLLIPRNDVAALATALLTLLSERALAERMGMAARVRALARFTIDACVTSFEELYAELASVSSREQARNVATA